jgi:hypothetical protein
VLNLPRLVRDRPDLVWRAYIPREPPALGEVKRDSSFSVEHHLLEQLNLSRFKLWAKMLRKGSGRRQPRASPEDRIPPFEKMVAWPNVWGFAQTHA